MARHEVVQDHRSACLLRHSIAAARVGAQIYGKVTGRDVHYSSDLIRDRKSPSFEGNVRPDAALVIQFGQLGPVKQYDLALSLANKTENTSFVKIGKRS